MQASRVADNISTHSYSRCGARGTTNGLTESLGVAPHAPPRYSLSIVCRSREWLRLQHGVFCEGRHARYKIDGPATERFTLRAAERSFHGGATCRLLTMYQREDSLQSCRDHQSRHAGALPPTQTLALPISRGVGSRVHAQNAEGNMACNLGVESRKKRPDRAVAIYPL